MKPFKYVKNLSLKSKSIVIFLFLAVMPIGAVSFLYYYQFNNILEQQVIDTSQRNLNAMQSNFSNLLNEVEDLSEYIIFNDEFNQYMTLDPDTEDQEEIRRLNRSLEAFLTFHITNNPYFNSITITGNNRMIIHMGENIEDQETEWKEKADELNGSVLWSDPYNIQTGWPSEDQQVISLFRQINDIHDISTPIGDAVVRLNEEQIYQHIIEGISNAPSESFILKKDGTIITHQNKNLVGSKFSNIETINQVEENNIDTVKIEDNNEAYYVVAESVDEFYIVSMINEEYILNELSGLRRITQLIVVGTLLLVLCAAIGFYINVIKPVINLTKEVEKVGRGDFGARAVVNSQDEVGVLNYRFNEMVLEISHLIDVRYKLQIQKKEAEIKAMQSQINPHFLYNTLDMIRWSARLEHAPKTGESIEHLSRIFRTSLSEGSLFIPLKNEIKNINSYLELQKRRMGDNLHAFVEVDQAVADCYVMKIILQPLIENSIVHGFTSNSKNNTIHVHAYKYENNLYIDVKDNGIGINKQKAEQSLLDNSKKQDNFALKNINDRLANVFGGDFGLNIIEKNKEGGTFIKIILPLVYSQEEAEQYILKEGKRDA